MTKKRPSVRVVMPVHGRIEPYTAYSLLEAQKYMTKKGYKFNVEFHIGESLINRARDVVAHNFLNEPDPHDYLMCIDSDIKFPKDSIHHLVQHQKRVVGANYRHKCSIERYAGRALKPYEPLSQAEFLPTGFMLVHRDVFKELIKRRLELGIKKYGTQDLGEVYQFYPTYVCKEGGLLSEDWGFTRLIQKAGIKTWMDNRIMLGHIGRAIW